MNTRKIPSVSDITLVICFSVLVAHVEASSAQTVRRGEVRMTLDSLDGLEIKAVPEKSGEPVKVKADIANYKGRRALHMLNDDTTMTARTASGGESLAIVKGSDFKDGTIEFDMVGMPRQGSNSQSRGFIGVAFHIQGDVEKFENFYLRFTNGRSDDQLRRNHSTQYTSFPDFPWHRLRQENPGL